VEVVHVAKLNVDSLLEDQTAEMLFDLYSVLIQFDFYFALLVNSGLRQLVHGAVFRQLRNS